MNTPNKLTILRIVLSFVCIGFIITGHYAFGAITFLIASLTDFFDGYLARKNNLISDLGKLLDPIADKVLIIGVFCAFLEVGVVNAWMVSLIMFREFIVTGLRLYGLNKGVILEAKKLGKHKTVSQIIGLSVIFISLILRDTLPDSNIVVFLYKWMIPFMMWYIVIITVYSGINYFWVNRKTIRAKQPRDAADCSTPLADRTRAAAGIVPTCSSCDKSTCRIQSPDFNASQTASAIYSHYTARFAYSCACAILASCSDVVFLNIKMLKSG